MILNLKKCLPQFKNLVKFSHTQQNVHPRIKLCKKVEDLKLLKSQLIVTGLVDYKHVISEFIGQCFDLGTPEFALSSFFASKNRSLLLQNLIIKRLCKLGFYPDVISVYKTCVISGCPSGDYTFPYVIKACSAVSDVGLGREIHCVVLRTGFDCNVVVQTALVDFYAKIGRVDVARLVFDGMPEWDVVSCNALISGYCFNGLDYDAFDVFHGIWVKGVKANVGTLASIVPVCTRLGFWKLGRCLHSYAVKAGFDRDESVIPALITMCASTGDIYVAKSLFDHSPIRDVVIWTSMISGYTQNQKPEQAFEMFLEMVHADLRPSTVTFASVVSCCEKMYNLSLGESLHGLLIKYGLEIQVSVAPALINMYAKLGDTESATHLFHQMPNKNTLLWNSVISGYVHQGLLHTSLDAVREMEVTGFEGDAISIINVLSACSELQALLLGKSAHAVSLRKGYDSNLNVSNLLLAFYSNCHQLHYSFKLFVRMDDKNSISWNTMISSCVHNGEIFTAESLLSEMQQAGLQLDVVSLISILPVYNGSSNLAQGTSLHAYALKFGFSSDVTLTNALISMYCNCDNMNAAALLFSTMMVRSLVSWNSLITGYRCHNLHKEVTVLFKEIINDGQKPNYITLLNVLPGCSTLLQGKSVHSYAIKTGAVLQSPVVTSLISMYSTFKNLFLCRSLFETGNKLDISLWNVMLSALVEAREPEQAFTLFQELLQTELQADYVTVLSVISACMQLNNLCIANSVVAFVMKNGFSNETSISNALIDLYAKGGDILMAKEIFDSLLDRDAVSWSTMINGYGLNGDGNAAISLLSQMENSGIIPDRVTYLNLLSACSHAGLAEQSKIIFNSMLRCGMQPSIEHYACLVDLLSRTGDLDEAYGIVKKLPGGPSASILESLLGACRVYGNVEVGEKVGKLLIEMNPVNSTVYVTLHNIYAGAGRWQDANRFRNVMDEKLLTKLPAFSMMKGQTS